MGAEFDRLKTEITEMTAKIDEVVAFIRANVNDPVALGAFADELDAGQLKLTEAMAPVVTPPEEPPVEPQPTFNP